MTKTLSTKDHLSNRMRCIRRALWIVLLLNLAVAIAKYFYGTATGSASMRADGIHSVFDSAGNVVGLVGISLAARPADEGHPYGHAKFETNASLLIGLLLLLAAFEVGSSAVGKLLTGNYGTEVTPWSFVVMIITLIINISVTAYERRCARKYQSEVLAADATHTLSDAMVSLGVIIGLVAVAWGFPLADPVMALVVTLAILVTACDVFKSGLATLSDRARISEEELRDAVLKVPGVRDAHQIRTRGTEGEVYADLHVLVAPEMTVGRAHALADDVEGVVCQKFPKVRETLVHIEPDDGHTE